MSSVKYLMSAGELKRMDNSVCFVRFDGHKVYLAVNDLREIFCMSELKLNTDVLNFLGKHQIMVHMFDYYQNYCGSFYPKEKFLSGRMLLSQLHAYEENRLVIAKKIVLGISCNITYVLQHYYKHGVSHVKDCLHWLKTTMPFDLEKANTISNIMSVEGEMWNRFYAEFAYILPKEFCFSKRVRRPPDNPMNALVSFGNSLLYAKSVNVLYETHLDQRVSFLHELADGRFSLSLDMSEIFKPVIVFRTIFDLVNRKQLQVEKHFLQEVNFCLLNEDGKKIFIQAFEKRLDDVFYHTKLKRKVSYRYAMKLDCYKLIKFILEGKDFEFFSLYEMQ